MKRFVRSVAGKVTIFVLFTLCLCLTAVCVAGAVIMLDQNLYETTEEAVLDSQQEQKLKEAAANFARSSLDPLWERENPSENLAFVLLDKVGRTVAASDNAETARKGGGFEKTELRLRVFLSSNGAFRDCYFLTEHLPDSTGAVDYTLEAYVKGDIPLSMGEQWQQKVVHLLFSMKYAVYPVGLLALLGCISLFVLLMCVAGRRPGTDALCAGALFRVPFELILAGAIVLGTSLICLGMEIDPAVAVLAVIADSNLFLGVSMSFASRIKQRVLLSGSLAYLCLRLLRRLSLLLWRSVRWIYCRLRKIGRALAQPFHSLPMIWKTALVMLGLCALELIVLLSCQKDELMVYWWLERLVLVPAILTLALELRQLQKAGEMIAAGNLTYQVDTRGLLWDLRRHAENLNSISAGMSNAVEQRLRSERMKTALITNVSHDIKTPLTSMINYASLIAAEPSQSANTAAYCEVLLRQAEKLKRLIEDLIEASKASTGNLEVTPAPCDAAIFLTQASGEYEERIKAAGLTLVTRTPAQAPYILADSRRMWRVFDNLMGNICKYAQSGTRVYLTLEAVETEAVITFKNTSRDILDISPDELLERFVRGDASRHAEGNGLGLSIARSLTELQGGTLKIEIDGDLFKVVLRFPILK